MSLPSTGKSSNSSSSSRAAGFCLLFAWSLSVGPEGFSEAVALVVVKAPSPDVPDMLGLGVDGAEEGICWRICGS